MNERQRRFCEEYLIDLNATNAARRAGYAESTAKCAANWIGGSKSQNPALRAEIDRLLIERRQRTQVSADRVVEELARIAFEEVPEAMDAADSADAGAAPKKPSRARTIGAGDSVRTQDRLRALELLGKHLGIFTEHMQLEQVLPVIVDDIGGADEPGGAKVAESEAGDE